MSYHLHHLHFTRYYCYLAWVSLLTFSLPLHVVAGSSFRDGYYQYGELVPVSCLNRTIESGEHIIDISGQLQYIPFPTCNETSFPFAFRYGISETITCTIDALPDTLYHLLEYYVHSDVPLACRVPTGSLSPQIGHEKPTANGDAGGDGSSEDNKDLFEIMPEDGPSYTPLTIALQGTLQRSHLHIWTNMNVLVHKFASAISPKKRKAKTAPGYVVAGIAYSLPEPNMTMQNEGEEEKSVSKEAQYSSLLASAKNPWTPGHGSKVIRGEPLTFKFRVSWFEDGENLGRIESPSFSGPPALGRGLAKLLFFAIAVGVGVLVTLFWQRRNGSRKRKSEGILGRIGNATGVTYGDNGRMNGYGGYAQGSGNRGLGGYGYGGYSTDKKD